MALQVCSRRAFLRGAGGVVVGLPLLESVGRKAQAAEGDALHRFLVFFHPQGTLRQRWLPNGTGTNFELSPLLAPLEAVREHIVVTSGVHNLLAPAMVNSNGHNRAGRTILSAQPFSANLNPDGSLKSAGQQAANGMSAGPSIDQYLAQRIDASTPYATLNFGVGGAEVGENQMLFAGADDPVDLEGSPQAAFDRLFSDIDTPTPTTLQRLRARRQSVLDTVNDSFSQLNARVSSADRIRLEAHAQKIRELEERLANEGEAGIGCSTPTLELPAGFDPNNSNFDDSSSRTFIDLMVMGLACDLARVGTLQYTQYQAPRFPWLGVPVPASFDSWHTMVHEGQQSHIDTIASVMGWYMQEFAYLIDQLATTPDGEGTLLDHTLAMSISEFGQGGTHDTHNLPIVLAGNLSGSLPTGRHVALPDATTNDLFTAILQLFGFDDSCFGYAEACNGPAAIT